MTTAATTTPANIYAPTLLLAVEDPSDAALPVEAAASWEDVPRWPCDNMVCASLACIEDNVHAANVSKEISFFISTPV
jgi:hypothetical protein